MSGVHLFAFITRTGRGRELVGGLIERHEGNIKWGMALFWEEYFQRY